MAGASTDDLAASTDSARPGPSAGRTARGASAGAPRSNRLHVVLLSIAAFIWMVPLLWTMYVSLRPKAETSRRGYFSIGGPINLDNYVTAWMNGNLRGYLVNTLIIVVPAVLLTLFLSSIFAFAVSRFSWRFNVTALIVVVAANLIPMQTIAIPVFQIFQHLPAPSWVSPSGQLVDTYYAVIIMDIAQQLGFCALVYSNYMKTLPAELREAALIDGAGPIRRYFSVVMPLCKPATGALGSLLTIWIYNDFFWPLLLIQKDAKTPITSGIVRLFGEHSGDVNMGAAGAIIAVIPTFIVYLLFRRQLVGGLTLGSTKG